MNLLQKISNWYFSKEALPYWCVFIFDCLMTFLAGLIVFWAYHKTGYNIEHFWGIVHTIMLYVLIAMIGFRVFRTYTGVVRYSSFVDLQHVAFANALSLIIASVIHYPFYYHLPRPLFEPFFLRHLVVMFILSTMLMWTGRVLIKMLYDLSYTSKGVMNAFIYGVKDGGVGLAKFIRNDKPARFRLRGFISPDASFEGHQLMGTGVYQVSDLDDALQRFRIRAVLVSPLRNHEFRNDQRLQSLLTKHGVRIYMTEGFSDGNSQRVHLKEVSIDDLLPRDEIKVDLESVSRMLTGQRILITGSAGSIGSEMVRQIAQFAPAEMMLIDQAETPQHDIRLMMTKQFPDIKVQAVVTSICKQQRMERIFSDFRPDYVFHAAAYKHVPMMEDNPSESIQNNVLGTKILADLSVKYGVKKFVMISTDKAVNPTNVMGCSKRICEIYVQALDSFIKRREERGERRENTLDKTPQPLSTIQNNSEHEPQASQPLERAKHIERLNRSSAAIEPLERSSAASQPFSTSLNLSQLPPQGACQFVTTRFGNVLGSNGSVIPLFERQIKEGGPVTVTDPEIIRYFMLIPEACKLVLEAGTMGNGGEIFVFDMGKPVKIADLAKRMILLSGAKNIEIKYTGLRPGEKLYEEMLSTEENTKPSFHEKIRIATVREYGFEKVSRDIDELIAISRQYDDMATVRKMKEIVPEFISNNSVYSALDRK